MRRPGPGLLRSGYRFLKFEVLYGTLLYGYGTSRHRKLVKGTTRSQAHTYTRFYRSPGQLAALTGPVLEHLSDGRARTELHINVFASSNGAECYTLASTLLNKAPDIDFKITGSDLHQEMVTRANAAVYSYDEVHYWATTKAFVSQTFDRLGDDYVVKPHIRERVRFVTANLLAPDLVEQFEPADLIFLQNVLCHLDPDEASQAFRSVAQLLKPRSALFVDGMDLDLRETLTREAGLVPLDFQCREIHEAARTHVGERWWNYYYGMEPYAFWHRDRTRRYSTIFFSDEAAGPNASDSSTPAAPTHGFAEIVHALSAYFGHRHDENSLGPKDSLLSSRLVDSDAIVNLVGFIEREFGIEVQKWDLVPNNFRSLNTIAELVTRRHRADRALVIPTHRQEQ